MNLERDLVDHTILIACFVSSVLFFLLSGQTLLKRRSQLYPSRDLEVMGERWCLSRQASRQRGCLSFTHISTMNDRKLLFR